MAAKRVDPPTGPSRLVSVVLPLLHGQADGRRRPTDQALARDHATCDCDPEQLRKERPRMPPQTEAGIASLGNRQSEIVDAATLSVPKSPSPLYSSSGGSTRLKS